MAEWCREQGVAIWEDSKGSGVFRRIQLQQRLPTPLNLPVQQAQAAAARNAAAAQAQSQAQAAAAQAQAARDQAQAARDQARAALQPQVAASQNNNGKPQVVAPAVGSFDIYFGRLHITEDFHDRATLGEYPLGFKVTYRPPALTLAQGESIVLVEENSFDGVAGLARGCRFDHEDSLKYDGHKLLPQYILMTRPATPRLLRTARSSAQEGATHGISPWPPFCKERVPRRRMLFCPA
jgi:hypothetical protein